MHRLFRLSILTVLIGILALMQVNAQNPVYLSGGVPAGQVRVILNDPAVVYYVTGSYVVGGTLIIEPGTTIIFAPDSRIIDSVGGQIIADGFAEATYTARPGGIDPRKNMNNMGWEGYGDLNYFLYETATNKTISVGTTRDLTVHPQKYNHIFNVILDLNTRQLKQLPLDRALLANEVPIPFEKAIIYRACGIENIQVTETDQRNLVPWSRLSQQNPSPNIVQGQIRFIGTPFSSYSKEWGHFVILPGARTAFFRNVKFENFRKDTTVDNKNYYGLASFPIGYTASQLKELNDNMKKLSNGGGGAITTFSSRTWLINCTFESNFARHKGGALQILQAPEGFPVANIALANYPATKNPNITNPDGSISSVNSNIKAIDYIDEPATFAEISCYDRQAFDDARVAVFLGRMRNLKFINNTVKLANFGVIYVNGVPVGLGDLDEVASIRREPWFNRAFGGAIYISGREDDPFPKQIEIGLGINNRINTSEGTKVFPQPDALECINNVAKSLQNSINSKGARGGAIYVGENTSLIVAGKFIANETSMPKYEEVNSGYDKGIYSMGGAIYLEQSLGRLQIRGGQNRGDNSTLFQNNKSGLGGAIFVNNNGDDVTPRPSPIIGGTDASLATRDYGFNVKFLNNKAISAGGAIFTKRNIWLNGAGGVAGDSVIGYGGDYRLLFDGNETGYAGGAISINISLVTANAPSDHWASQIRRSIFTKNYVGQNLSGNERTEVRGGGAIYSFQGDIVAIKGVEFRENKVWNGNGGAIAMVAPHTSVRRIVTTDLDNITFDANGAPISFTERNDIFTFNSDVFPPDVRMLTRFLDNEVSVDEDLMDTQMGSGTTQIQAGTLITDNNINAIAFRNTDYGIAVGNNGTILLLERRPDGVRWQWTYKNWSSDVHFTDVKYLNDNTIVIVGTQGIVLKSTNQGNTWSVKRQPAPENLNLNSVFFVTTFLGYAVGQGGVILRTNDAGETWTALPSITTINLNEVYFTSDQIGYIVGNAGVLLKTTNGGLNWSAYFTGISSNLNGIYFRNMNYGYAVGDYGMIYRTTNAGIGWESVYDNANINLKKVFFISDNIGFAVGSTGTIVKTTDGGNTWNLASITSYDLADIYFVNASFGLVCGATGHIFLTSNAGENWTRVRPFDESIIDVVRYHPEKTMVIPENGIGLGGAIYVLDRQSDERLNRADSTWFNRVRIQNNKAFTGAAVYSDIFNYSLIFSRSLITGNIATSEIGAEQNVITGPYKNLPENVLNPNKASSDLAGAILYGEIMGPLPSLAYSEKANSIYNNTARFLIRLPDAPNTKGLLSGTTGIGSSGTDTLIGNYWGLTEANVTMLIEGTNGLALNYTFFVDTDGETRLQFLFVPDPNRGNVLLQQGPFESIGVYTYTPIPLRNGIDENTPDYDNSIPEKLLMSGRVYDLFDKGTDIKVANYQNRRMSPIEDFAVGMVRGLQYIDDPNSPHNGKYVRRWLKDPFLSEDPRFPGLAELQGEFRPDSLGRFYHPIGYPLYLEAKVDYNGDPNLVNDDPRLLNETVFFVINETTGDFIRINLKQVNEGNKKDIFRARVELVPDSTNRANNPMFRRIREGLLNFGSGKTLLDALYRNPYNEDGATLPGRKYHARFDQLGNEPNLFKNRRTGYPVPYFDPSNNDMVTFFAGERFRALPVNVGDSIYVVSRTMLWKYGYDQAKAGGIHFTIGKTTMPPQFTGDVVKLQERKVLDTIPSDYPWENQKVLWNDEFLNKIFITEDRDYPNYDGWYSNPDAPDVGIDAVGRDSIFAVTAIDPNKFYDPRSYIYPERYARLTYRWEVDPGSAVSRWLFVDTIPAKYGNITNYKDGAEGYIVFRGKPINPYIVPGGEEVRVYVDNYPPHYRTIDSLKKLEPPLPQDVIEAYLNLFPRYLHAWKYDNDLARYLQQDTIDNGLLYTRDYKFRLFVVDSAPRFLAHNAQREIVRMRLSSNRVDTATYVVYEPSKYTCNLTNSGKLKANLTNKLRFQIDVNTDDEMEDQWAVLWDQRFGRTPWDFRFGKTAYGFVNVAARNDEEVVIDSAFVNWRNQNETLLQQVRPIWMANQYIKQYNSDDQADQFIRDFTTKGQLNIRIDSATAVNLLKPALQVNGAMNVDTVFTVVVNDGHGGINVKQFPVYINVAPRIVTDMLPPAKEDFEYNMTDQFNQLMDTTRQIKVYDPNFDQEHRFELIYDDYPQNQIPRDPCYPEAGAWDLTGLKTTPKWLKINPISGMLYGIPGVKDAPKNVRVTVAVWDIIDGQRELSAIKVLDLRVDSTNHKPKLVSIPPVRCVDRGKPYSDTITVVDRDLLRGERPGDPSEVLTIRVLRPTTGLSVNPSTVAGPRSSDSAKVVIFTANLNIPPDDDGKITIIIEVTDLSGMRDTIIYRLKYSDPTDFVCPITIRNSKGAYQVLEFGTARSGATTGYGLDGEPVGTLDYNFCEYELPPRPYQDIFDARWDIPNTLGILRNIYPRAQTGVIDERLYRAIFNAGGEGGLNYPVTISWNITDIPAKDDATKNPTGASWYIRDPWSLGNFFIFNMRTGIGSSNPNVATGQLVGDIFTITVTQTTLNEFVIVHDWASDVNDDQLSNNIVTSINSITPNPFSNGTTIKFSVNIPSRLKLEVFDNLGNLVKILADGDYTPGFYTLPWNGLDANGAELPSGIYTCRLTAGSVVSTYQMIIVK